ncbi:MAG: hypothetical protein LBV74_08530 [Tannerella sp.]|jgi:hypothetical protein|nr:hypothetical protein [Tannerella sp.]
METFLIPTNFSVKNQEHIYLLQQALVALKFNIDPSEIKERRYDKSTMEAVRSFQEQHCLPLNSNVPSETINAVNAELERLYRVCGYLTNDYGMNIEGVRYEIRKTYFNGETLSIGMGITLSDGSFRSYIDISNESLGQDGLLKDKLCVEITFLQDDKPVFTSNKLLIADLENIFKFSSDKLTYRGKVIYTSLLETLKNNKIDPYILQSMSPDELKKLSEFTGIEVEILMRLILSELLMKNFENVDPMSIFAFLYQNYPSNMPLQLFPSEGVDKPEEWLSYKDNLKEVIYAGLMLIPEELLTDILYTASKLFYINSLSMDQVKGIVKNILYRRVDTSYEFPILEGNVRLKDLIEMARTSLSEEYKKEIAGLFVANVHDFDTFIEVLNNEENKKRYYEDNVNKLTLCFQASRVIRNHIPFVSFVMERIPAEKGIRYLAILSKEDWRKWIEESKSGYPDDLKGIEKYIELIYNTVQRLYPDLSSVSEIKKIKGFEGSGQMLEELLIQNPDFDLLTDKMEKITEGWDEKTVEEFKTIQRVYRVSPNPTVAAKMLEKDIRSSGQIYYMGKKQLEERFRDTLTKAEVNNVFNMATARFTNALSAYTQFSKDLSWNGPQLISKYDREAIIAELKKEFPDIETLFGPTDSCECEHDSSVYSAAAYLADLLAYLDARGATQGNSTSVKYHLNLRRPDLSLIYLNAQNTNTVLPYIDLVCEVLEAAVLNAVRNVDQCQSTLSSKELCAAPEHIMTGAYDILKDCMYPMYAPLNLYQTEIRSYLKDMGIERHGLMKTFQSGQNPDNTAIASEFFQLTNLEHKVVTASSSYTPAQRNQAWYNMGSGVMMVTDFMKHSRLSVKEVIDLSKATWVGIKFPELGTKCIFSDKSVTGNTAQFDRAHRFIRLRNKSGWKIWELNLLLTNSKIATPKQGEYDNLGTETIYNLMLFRQQQTVLGLEADSLLAFYGNMHAGEVWENAKKQNCLYDKIFFRKAFSNPLNSNLESIKAGNNVTLSDGDKNLIAACLSITKSDYKLLEGTTTGNVGLAYLSYLYRHATLAKALKISIPELHALFRVKGVALSVTNLFDLNMVNGLIDASKKIDHSKLSLTEYDYLLGYAYNSTIDPDKSVGLTNNLLKTYTDKLKEILDGFISLNKPQSSEIESVSGGFRAVESYTQYFLNYLSQLEGFKDNEEIEELIRIIECRSVKTDDDIDKFVSMLFPKILGFSLGNDLHKVTLTSAGLIGRYNAVCSYINQIVPAVEIRDRLSEYFDLCGDTMEIYLSSSYNSTTLINIFLDKNKYASPAKEIYESLLLIHKASLVIKKYAVSTTGFELLLRIGTKIMFNWFAFKVNAVGTPVVSFADLVALNDMLELNEKYGQTLEGQTLLSTIDTVTNINTFKQVLCQLTGWSSVDLDFLTGATCFNVTNIMAFYQPTTYRQIEACLSMKELAGVSIQSICNWRMRVDDAKEKEYGNETKSAAKAKYDIDAWLEKLAAIQKPIREAKAEALASYLIAKELHTTRPKWFDRNDLYAYFLLDTEMSACMKTSRIVQATCSVQLFVQRCFLNLETPNVVVDESYDTEWRQWEWMKKYRLWEANRKIFLYPENWIEPELRDDKTPFFKELEDELSQGDITAEHAENVFENYLQKLHEVSNLFICGIYREMVAQDGTEITNKGGGGHLRDTSGLNTDRLHVIGRSRSTPYQFYYRNYNALTAVWSPWEKIDLDIKGDMVIPVVYNRRLHLFWISTVEKAYNQNHKKDDNNPVISYTETQLGWSVYKAGKWTKIQYSQKKHVQTADNFEYNYSMVCSFNQSTNELVFSIYRLYKMYDSNIEELFSQYECTGSFFFNGDAYRVVSYKTNFQALDKVTGKMELLSKPDISDGSSYFYPCRTFLLASRLYTMPTASSERTNVYLHNHAFDHAAQKIIDTRKKDPNVLQMIHNWEGMWYGIFQSHLFTPFFYQDSERVFFVKPHDWNWKNNISQYGFIPFYHPYTRLFIKELNRAGIPGLLNRNIQMNPQEYIPQNTYVFDEEYRPVNGAHATAGYETDIIDFNLSGSHSIYNWELFFHAPLYIACKLSQNQKFEEAMQWFQSIFDPTNKGQGNSPQKFWITKPFFTLSTTENRAQQISNILKNIESHAKEVNAWLNNPYKPHLIARTRPVAYQRTVVMKYIDNLIDWADQLFRQDSMESNNEATLLYILAYEILGKRPVVLPNNSQQPFPPEKVNYANMTTHTAYSWEYLFDNAFQYSFNRNENVLSIARAEVTESSAFARTSHYNVATQEVSAKTKSLVIKENLSVENIKNAPLKPLAYEKSSMLVAQQRLISIPYLQEHTVFSPLPRIDAEHFCIPFNEDLLHYWDTVEDRLFKLRHCMNIEGVVRELPLFEPPIDPAMLVKAVASGLSIGDALNDITAPQPYYRFRIIVQKALEFTGEVKQLGEKMLSALEKKDAEALNLLRSSQEINLQQAGKQIRKLQIEEAKQNIENLNEVIKTTEARKAYYAGRELMNALETGAYNLTTASFILDAIVSGGYLTAGIFAVIPDISVGGAGVFGSPFFGSKVFGGDKMAIAMNAAMNAMSNTSNLLSKTASNLLTKAGYQRRKEDWDFQAKMADMELQQLNKQLTAAEIRLMMAEKELENFELQIEQSKSVLEYYKSKYTNEALYNWMITQISTIYFRSYKLAYDMAKKAEKCYRHELGVYVYERKNDFIQFGYWDSLKKGLLSGDKLIHDLHRLEAAYIDNNKRRLELTKHVSLAQMFPGKLAELLTSANNQTTLGLPEFIFDMDYPGHYMRRIKSVSVTIPNVSGPYTNVSFMLSLQSAKVRVKPTGDNYDEEPVGNDPRFNYQTGGIQSICTSHAQNDSGMFELNFGDERYLPFEGAGVISQWILSLPAGCNQFDLSSISDIILHVNYTACYDGLLAQKAKTALESQLPNAGAILFNLKQDFPDAWAEMDAETENNAMNFSVKTEHFPFFLRGRAQETGIAKIVVFASCTEQGNNPDNIGLTLKKGSDITLAITLNRYPHENGNILLYAGFIDVSAVLVAGNWEIEITGMAPGRIENLVTGFALGWGDGNVHSFSNEFGGEFH